ncbi:MAG: O-antigen/teichoic acid export membrane protein [Francisellaceae bacterium]|jgi:O-antigen/teichoic acid export membrane protein
MFKNIKIKVSAYLDVHTFEVLTKSMSSSLVKVGGMVLAFLISVYLGRTLGAEGLGIINLSFRIVNILIIFGLLGIMQIIIREVAIAHEEKNNEHIINVMSTAYLMSGVMTLLISLVFIYLSPFLANTVFNEPRLTYPLMIALLVMAPQAFSQMFAASLIGRRKIWQSNLADQCLNVLISGLIFFVLWLNKVDLTVDIAAIVYAMGRLLVTIGMGLYWKKILFSSDKKVYQFKSLYIKAYPIFITSLSLAILTNSGIILLGVLSDSENVGLFTVAARLADLTIFMLHVANSAVSPKISSLYKQNRMKELETMLQKTTQFLFFIGLVFFITFVFLGEYILAIWGEEFKEAYWILIILCFGQFVNISTGAAGQILTMTGNQKKQRAIALKCLFVVIVLMPIFISLWGSIGAALITTVGITSINIASLSCAQKVTGIKVVRFFDIKGIMGSKYKGDVK